MTSESSTINLFSLAISVGLLCPALAAGAFAYAWRGSLPRVLWFVGIGGIASYILMAACLTWALSDIGFTGNPSATPQTLLSPIAMRYLLFMLLWMAGSVVILLITRRLLSK